MTTIINTPASNGGGDSGFGFVVGALFVIVIIVVALFFALPAFRNRQTTTTGATVNLQIPAATPK